jgi:MFS family permease
MNGLFQAGGAIGTFALPWFADKWGRKWACAVVKAPLFTKRVAQGN